jgi:hypothetical protein
MPSPTESTQGEQMKSPASTSRNPAETLTIRLAVSTDAAALRRLAQLDSAPPPEPVPMLVAEVGGELRAALPVAGGPAIADPFRPTAELVAILAERARQLAPPPPCRSAWRWRPLRAARPHIMRRFFMSWPSPAMAVAFVALLAALSGTAIALPGSNTVDSGDIINGQVKGKDIRNNAVTAKKVKNDSLTGLDINESTLGQVPSANTAGSANTATTANGVAANGVNTAAIVDDAVTGPKIAADAVGASELKGTYAAVSGGVPAAADTFVDAAATCNAGDAVLGGGFAWLNDADEIETVFSTPDPLTDPNRWIVRSRSGAANTLFAWAVCLAA